MRELAAVKEENAELTQTLAAIHKETIHLVQQCIEAQQLIATQTKEISGYIQAGIERAEAERRENECLEEAYKKPST